MSKLNQPDHPHNRGGVIHSYQRYDPVKMPGPISQIENQADLASLGMEHMLMFGSMRELTEEELARAIHIDPSQIAGLGPSMDALIAMLEARKREILETYQTKHTLKQADRQYHELAESLYPPGKYRKRYYEAVRDEQLHDLERLWYSQSDERDDFARGLVQLMDVLADKYQVEDLEANYTFTGKKKMTVPEALEIKEELEKIDELLEQLKQAKETAQLGIIDMDQLSEFAEGDQLDELEAMQRRVEDLVREAARQQGLEKGKTGYELSPKAYRLFQSKVLGEIFSNLTAGKTGRHQADLSGDGAVELQRTRPYEFGDSVANIDITSTLTNAMIRQGSNRLPIRLRSDDIEVHETRNNPKCATVVVIDMSGSMRSGGVYVDAKRMALALDGLIRKEYPGDFLQFIEMYSVAKARHISEIPALMPKIPTIRDPVVRLRADFSDPNVNEYRIPQHFTNMQHAMVLGRRLLAAQDTPNRQMLIISDGLPTAHYEEEQLYLLYPPDPRTEQATLREAKLCAQEGITLNMFLVPSWSQSEEDIRFSYRLAESTKGRVFFTAGGDLDRYVVWDYVNNRKTMIG